MGFQFMLILGLLGMYFDAAVVFVTNSSLFFRLAVAILWLSPSNFCIFIDFLLLHIVNCPSTKKLPPMGFLTATCSRGELLDSLGFQFVATRGAKSHHKVFLDNTQRIAKPNCFKKQCSSSSLPKVITGPN